MADLYGLPVIKSPYLPEGTVLVFDPTAMPRFEPEAIFTPLRTSGELNLRLDWSPMALSTQWASTIYGLDFHDDMVDSFLYAWTEPTKYRGLARVVHMVRRALRRFR